MYHPPSPVVIDTTSSPHARLHSVPITSVRFADTFWEPRRQINRAITLPEQYQHCESTGRIDNFRRASGKRPDLAFQGIFFNDSDVYKWLEAVAWTLASNPDSQLEAVADAVIEEIAAAQQPDGYLNTYFMFDKADQRWTNFDLHEMYCAGHLFQAAIAHYRSTGKRSLLDIAIRFADYLDRTFGPEEQGKRVHTDGHEEVEMALVELYRTTGEERYLNLAQFFVDVRGYGKLKHPSAHFGSAYYQDATPFRDMDSVVGHAVRMVYYTCGAADLYLERGEGALLDALHRLWNNMTSRKMYVSGGIGSRYEGEAFGGDYELPNERAYTETCAAIGSVMWNHRMLALSADARYADLMELTLYNAVLPGLGLDGQRYFYQNPLANDGSHRRQPWFGCACCPPNVARLLAQLPGYVLSTSEQGIWMHLYVQGQASITLTNERVIELTTETRYPWDGDVRVIIRGKGEFSLFLRVPAWANGATLEVNGQPWIASVEPGQYVELCREWQPGDMVHLRLPMEVRRAASHPYVFENAGRVALMRGPILYCAEAADNQGVDIRDLMLPSETPIQAEFRDDLLNGVVVLRTEAEHAAGQGSDGALYQLTPIQERQRTTTTLTAIPYYAWANREPGQMQVWLRSRDSES